MSARPWEQLESFDMPDEPSDADIRRALRILRTGGAIGSPPDSPATVWTVACTRWLCGLGADQGDTVAYARVAKIGAANAVPIMPSALARAGRRI
jgi:hypothetical protein